MSVGYLRTRPRRGGPPFSGWGEGPPLGTMAPPGTLTQPRRRSMAQRSQGGELGLDRHSLGKHGNREESKQNIYFVEFQKPGNRCKYSLSFKSTSIHRLFIAPDEYLPGDCLAIRSGQSHPEVRFNGLFSPLYILEASPMGLLGQEDPAGCDPVLCYVRDASLGPEGNELF